MERDKGEKSLIKSTFETKEAIVENEHDAGHFECELIVETVEGLPEVCRFEGGKVGLENKVDPNTQGDEKKEHVHDIGDEKKLACEGVVPMKYFFHRKR